MTKSGCPSIEYEPFERKLGRSYKECSEWRTNVIDIIEKIRPDLTIISNAGNYMRNIEDDEETFWKLALTGTLNKISTASKKIAVIQDTPWLEHDAPDCLSHAVWRRLDPSDTCTFSSFNRNQNAVHLAQSAGTAQLVNAYTVDMNEDICSETRCPIYENGIIKFSDDHHLTRRFSKTLATGLNAKMLGSM